MLKVDGLTKVFGGFRALAGVSLEIGTGEVRAIIGPNGAGKTTFIHVVSGLLKPTAGRIYLAGADITRCSASQRARQGLARTFQITSLFRGLTILEHIQLARRAPGRSGCGREAIPEGVRSLLADVGLEMSSERTVETLSHGDQRVLEVAMALAADPILLLLDEPTAGMSAVETQTMISLIKRHLRGKISVLIVEHDMNVVAETADRITVLAAGIVISEGLPQTVLTDPHVKEVYLGSPAGT